MRGLEGVARQGLEGQRGAGLPECSGDRLDQLVLQDPHTSDTVVGKPAPVRQQGTDVTWEGDML